MRLAFTYTLATLFLGIIFSSSAFAQAAPTRQNPSTVQQTAEPGTGAELVKCGRISDSGESGRECTFQDLITLVGDTITFIIEKIIAPLLVLGLVYHGARMVIYPDKAAERAKIKKGLWAMLIGVVFMLGAWLIVKTITVSFGVKFSDNPQTGVIQFLE
jgi:hypothetical protein